MTANRWTPSEIERLLALKAEGLTPEQIGKRLNRTSKSVKTRLAYMKLTPAQRAARLEYDRNRRNFQNKAVSKVAGVEFEARKSARPEQDVIVERDRRHSAPMRDLTAAFFGDPPVGYSALERRT
jgi:hypothetical protein